MAILVSQGIDPHMEKRGRIAAAAEAKRQEEVQARLDREGRFAACAERWLDYLPTAAKSEKYCQTSGWAVRTYLTPVLGDLPLPQITPDHIQAAVDAAPAIQRATRVTVYDTAFAIFKWAKGTGGGRIVAHNVVAEVDRPPKPEPRDRYLSDDELAAVWTASGHLEPLWSAFYRLAIFTGKRRSELARMEWSELDREAKEWLIPGKRTKNGVADLVPLTDGMIGQLDALAEAASLRGEEAGSEEWPTSGFVLSRDGKAPIGNHSKVKRLLDEAVAKSRHDTPLPHWTFHDLRRTVGTGMQKLGVRFEVTEALLNHTGRSRAGVAGIYQRHDWKSEKREALTKWTTHVRQLAARADAPKVVSIEAARRK